MSRGHNIIRLTSGSDRITATVGDEDVLDADCYVDENQHFARITLHGLQTGSTTLTLTDEATGVEQTAEVKVTDTYLAYHINYSNHPTLQTGTVLYLTNNKARDCYFFTLDHLQGTLRPTPFAQGSYEFCVRQETDKNGNTAMNPYLSLTYLADDDGQPNDDTTAHNFRIDLDGTSSPTLAAIEAALGVDWQALIDQAATTHGDAIVSYYLQLSLPGTDYVIEGYIDTQQIPENVLK